MSKETTPGPWAWRWKSGSLHRVGAPPYAYGDAVLYPTYDYDSGTDVEIKEADACLIAAAPDLLAALKAVVAISDRKHDAWDAAHAAIVKAEGGTPENVSVDEAIGFAAAAITKVADAWDDYQSRLGNLTEREESMIRRAFLSGWRAREKTNA